VTDRPFKPDIQGAPGLRWYPRVAGWEARWRPRPDLVQRGFRPKSVGLWRSTKETPEPSSAELAYIQDRCERLQADMLVWGRGGLVQESSFDGTVRSLVQCYETDPDSDFHKLRFQSKRNSRYRCLVLIRDYGDQAVADIDARLIKRWHEGWTVDGKIATGHMMVTTLRTLMGFGATYFKKHQGGADCATVRGLLSMMKFPNIKPRNVCLTAEHAIAIRAEAHKQGMPSIALAQAIQFEVALRQKDVIGEWVPTSEPGVSDVIAGNDKWTRGIRWNEIDANLILQHETSKRGKDIEFNLRLAPMVMEELKLVLGLNLVDGLTRSKLPTSGPVIVYERTGMPYYQHQFGKEWKCIARAAGIPDGVHNMDSRAGAITEATEAGVPLEHVQHLATHSNITTTQGYSRGKTEKVESVARARIEHRNRK